MAANNLVKGALLLTLAGFISKVLSAGYRIPLQNLTGDIGFYVYQQVYPLLGIAFVLALYGFPSAVSKIAVDLKSEGNVLSFKRFYVPVFFILLGINTALFLFIRLNADSLAIWVGDENLVATYRVAAFLFLLIPFVALLRGVFQGEMQMKPTAFSQIGEQLFRVIIIILAAFYVSYHNEDIYMIGKAGGLASIIGMVVALFILVFLFIKYKPVKQGTYRIPWNDYIRTILIFGVVASLNHMILLMIQFADAFTLVPSLKDYGLTQLEAMVAKGVYDRGQPLIQLGTVLGSSFALALIPAVSKRKLYSESTLFYKQIEGALSFSFYIAAGATIGLIVIFPEANMLLFQNNHGVTALRIVVLSIVLSSIAITGLSILQGLDYMKRTAGFILAALFIKWIANQMLVPFWGIIGSAIATVISLLALCVVVLFELKRKLPGLYIFQKIKWKIFLKASSSMVLFLVLTQLITMHVEFYSRTVLFIYILFIICIGGLIYLVTLLRGRAFTEDELSMLPFAAKLIRLQRRK
ncbi:oligosaccharide flippase family protein [Ornithinibacillus sp. L9]|uniref:Oligosaccharide flippase family protein n=1 Tax=Ornithinibacillus caprae TaxID=2678566 RepID=A0A6N8FJB6_9BACI|nr:polysaccharide biosynthesis protein [Ornithinibacillus caprae]MUK88067.1 oligosaccharide flippase family protein [Ornithinibacillus caprae]